MDATKRMLVGCFLGREEVGTEALGGGGGGVVALILPCLADHYPQTATLEQRVHNTHAVAVPSC